MVSVGGGARRQKGREQRYCIELPVAELLEDSFVLLRNTNKINYRSAHMHLLCVRKETEARKQRLKEDRIAVAIRKRVYKHMHIVLHLLLAGIGNKGAKFIDTRLEVINRILSVVLQLLCPRFGLVLQSVGQINGRGYKCGGLESKHSNLRSYMYIFTDRCPHVL